MLNNNNNNSNSNNTERKKSHSSHSNRWCISSCVETNLGKTWCESRLVLNSLFPDKQNHLRSKELRCVEHKRSSRDPKWCTKRDFHKAAKGPFINDVAALGGRGYQWFCDNSVKALLLKSVTMGGRGVKNLNKKLRDVFYERTLLSSVSSGGSRQNCQALDRIVYFSVKPL